MPVRKKGNRMAYRQNVTTYVHDQIYLRKVLHVDAFLYQLQDDNLYFVIEIREGGTALLTRRVIRADAFELIDVGDTVAPERDGIQRHIDSPWARKHAPRIRALHARYIRPELDAFRAAHRRTSIRLHYVWSDPRVNDPGEGLENLYSITGYAKHAPADARPAVQAPATPGWNARDRSMLRTLDKLLK